MPTSSAVRVADSQGTVLEGAVHARRALAGQVDGAHRQTTAARPIDVLNLSLGYYHETPEDDLFDRR